MEKPRLSIVVVNFNRRDRLCHCLSSVEKAASDVGMELLVVDNGSSDGSVEMVRKEFPHAFLFQQKTNVGFSRAVNSALRKAAGDYFLCLNNDTWLYPMSLDRLVAFMDRHPQAGIVGGKVLNADGTLQLSARSFPTFSTLFFNRTSLGTRLFPQNPFSRRYLLSDWGHGETRKVDWVSGAFLAIRRETCEAIGLLDERFFLFCEDVDWCLRASRAGYQVVYFPEAAVIHYLEHRPNASQAILAHHRSMYRFYQKHLRRSALWDPFVGVGIGLRAAMALGSHLLFRRP